MEAVSDLRGGSFCDSQVLVVADICNFEALASALVLREFVMKIQMDSGWELGASIPVVLSKDDYESFFGQNKWRGVPEKAQHLILICTNGVFEHPSVLKMLLASEGKMKIMPILSDENFHFPHDAFLESHRHVAA